MIWSAASESLDDRAARIAAEEHADSVQETGEAYTEFHGWVLTCSWCDTGQVRAATKTAAVALMQEHYDKVCGDSAPRVTR
jgi:hypothetical protein